MGDRWDSLKKLILSALARHGALGVRMIASYVEETPETVQPVVDLLKKEGKVDSITGKSTKRYRIKDVAPGP